MALPDHDVDRLSALLRTLPAETMPMSLSVLDGYVLGVLACPDVISPPDWMPLVWGKSGEARFPDESTAADAIGAVMAHFHSVAEQVMRSHRVEPIYDVDPESGEVLWQAWVDGFNRAMALRPDAWRQLVDQADEETRATLIFLLALPEIYADHSGLPSEDIDVVFLEAPGLIPKCAERILYRSRPELFHVEAANPSETPSEADL